MISRSAAPPFPLFDMLTGLTVGNFIMAGFCGHPRERNKDCEIDGGWASGGA